MRKGKVNGRLECMKQNEIRDRIKKKKRGGNARGVKWGTRDKKKK